MRQEGYVFYFNSAFYGAAIFFMASFLYLIILSNFEGIIIFIENLVKEIFPGLDYRLFSTSLSISVIALLVGTFLGRILNNIPYFSKYLNWYFYQQSIKDIDSERILFRSIKRSLPVCLSMEDGKVYVGFVIRTFDPVSEVKEIRILPLISGYKKRNTKKIVFTTFYDEIYQKIEDEKIGNHLNHLEIGDFEKVLPFAKIDCINLFDIEAYNEFSNKNKLIVC